MAQEKRIHALITTTDKTGLFLPLDEAGLAEAVKYSADNFLAKTDADGFYVKLTGDETVNGVKTWNNQGIFNAGINVTAGGATILGNVGIGVAQDNHLLLVKGSAPSYMASFQQDNNTGLGVAIYAVSVATDLPLLRVYSSQTAGLYMETGGNLGLGTITPASTIGFGEVFHIYGAVDVSIRLEGGAGSWEMGNNSAAKLQLYSDAGLRAFFTPLASDPDILTLDGLSGSGGIYIDSAATGQSHIVFGATGGRGRADAGMYYSDNAGLIYFQTGGTDTLWINAAGFVSIGIAPSIGILTIGTANPGGNIMIFMTATGGAGKTETVLRNFDEDSDVVHTIQAGSETWASGARATDHAFVIYEGVATSPFFEISTTGVVKIPNLAGTGERNVSVSPDGTLVIGAGTSASPWNTTTDPPNISFVAGFVGIGTTLPGQALTISTGTDLVQQVRNQSTITGGEVHYTLAPENNNLQIISYASSHALYPLKNMIFTSEANATIQIGTGVPGSLKGVTIAASGWTGIGSAAATPTQLLDVAQDHPGSTQLKVRNADSGDGGTALLSVDANSSGGGTCNIYAYSQGTTGDILGSPKSGASVVYGGSGISGLIIGASAADINFGIGTLNIMKMKPNGSVGIGSAVDPSAWLVRVEKDWSAGWMVSIENQSTVSGGGLYVESNAVGQVMYIRGKADNGNTLVIDGTGTRQGITISTSSVEIWSMEIINPGADGWELNAFAIRDVLDNQYEMVIERSGHIYFPQMLVSTSGGSDVNYNPGGKGGELYVFSSDERMKSNIAEWTVNAIAVLHLFQPKQYEANDRPGIVRHGWIAQEAVDHIPDMFPVHEDSGMYTISSATILPYFHKAILELKAEIELLKTQIP